MEILSDDMGPMSHRNIEIGPKSQRNLEDMVNSPNIIYEDKDEN